MYPVANKMKKDFKKDWAQVRKLQESIGNGSV